MQPYIWRFGGSLGRMDAPEPIQVTPYDEILPNTLTKKLFLVTLAALAGVSAPAALLPVPLVPVWLDNRQTQVYRAQPLLPRRCQRQ